MVEVVWTVEATRAYVALTGELHPNCLVPVWSLEDAGDQWVSIPEYHASGKYYLEIRARFGHCCSRSQCDQMHDQVEAWRAAR